MLRSEDIRHKKMAMESMMIKEITENKKEYLNLLLLADEQESMIDRYLDRGRMYVLEDNGVKCECVVTDEGNGILENKKHCYGACVSGQGLCENADQLYCTRIQWAI